MIFDSHYSGTPVALIAEQAGCQAEASFRKAFKDVTGESPGVVRKAGAGSR
jgi:transcriptional regulator GlxA family with amidase domain